MSPCSSDYVLAISSSLRIVSTDSLLSQVASAFPTRGFRRYSKVSFSTELSCNFVLVAALHGQVKTLTATHEGGVLLRQPINFCIEDQHPLCSLQILPKTFIVILHGRLWEVTKLISCW